MTREPEPNAPAAGAAAAPDGEPAPASRSSAGADVKSPATEPTEVARPISAHRAVTVVAQPDKLAPGRFATPRQPPIAHQDTVSDSEPSAAAPALRLEPLASGARYQARRELGRGGMGRVLEATDLQLGRVVAVKESFATDADGRQRFEREVAITARLEHPAIVPLYDAGLTAEGRAFYVMRKLSGRGLDVVMPELATLDERIAMLPALLTACDAVAHAHARQVVHRDLKPGNILIGDHGETMVIDWGLAKVIDGREVERAAEVSTFPADAPSVPPSNAEALLPADALRTVVGSVFGTPGFMSPEQARGEAFDMRGDVYALGATLYHLLAGRPPHVGSSATEVIDRVGVEPPPPLAEAAVGAPAELVAIVEKAMAFATKDRYPDASALASDLRRFLAGQLVAAHRYTLWQRVQRAAKQHRAAFLVAGASLVLVATLSALSVARIISERDQADEARRAALREQRLAEAARDEAAARTEELIVTQAHGLIEQNPTAAIALLKRLSPRSAAWPKARMVATGALAEGITSAVRSTGSRVPSLFEMSPRGDNVLIGEDRGSVRLLDLTTLRDRELLNVGARARGCWIRDGAAVLLANEPLGMVLRDLDSGLTRTVPVPTPVDTLACHPSGVVAYLDDAGALWRVDVAMARVHKLETGIKAEQLAVTPDGAWLAIGGRREAALLDRDGGLQRRFTGEVLRIITSAKGRVGIMFRDRLIDFDPASAAAPTELPMPKYPIAIYYVAERIRLLTAGNRLLRGDGSVDVDLPSTPAGSAAFGDRTTALGLNDGSLWLAGWWGARLLRTPSSSPIIRVAGRPGSARLAAWTQDGVLVWNLGGAIPRSIPLGAAAGQLVFLGEDRLAVAGNGQWMWIDLASGETAQLDSDELPLFDRKLVDVERGNALLIDPLAGRVLLARWAKPDSVEVWRRRVRTAALLGDGSVALGGGDETVSVGERAEGATQLEMAHPVVAMASLGEHGLVMVDAEGELMTYDRASGERRHGSLGEPPDGPLIEDGAGGAVVAVAGRLLRWRAGATEELARMGEPIERMTRYQHYLAMLTRSGLFTLDLDAPAPPRRVATSIRNQQLNEGSRWSIGIGARGLIEMVDIATGVRWTKSLHGGLSTFAVSPRGTRIAQVLGRELALWTYEIPEEPAALRAWLDRATNAAIDDNLDVVWTAP